MAKAAASGERTAEVLEQLAAGVERLASSAAWTDWLDTQARFHAYSFRNVLLIAMQRPDATRVAGFQTWKALGRQVRRGEHGIRILAPVVRRRVREDQDGEERSARVLLGFRVVSVFDIAQTEGAELPPLPCTVLGDEAPEGVYDALVRVAADEGYAVVDHRFGDATNGDCDYDARRIRISAVNARAMRVKTLAHELGHALLHDGWAAPRALKELEAESVAYVVCSALGIASDAYSFGYLALWAGGGAVAVEAIQCSAERIARTAGRILAEVSQSESHEPSHTEVPA